MRKSGRILAALLALLLLLGALAVPGLADRSGDEPGLAQRAATWDTGDLTARSKKKKNNATPTPAVTPVPTTAPAAKGNGVTPVPEGPITDPQSMADWLFAHDMELPDNFITKKEAQALGWDSSYNYVSDVAPGKSIGGDYFGNYEKKLPTGKGISYREADCYYTKGKRNAYRIIYCPSERRVWYTEDHYNTFTELFPSGT